MLESFDVVLNTDVVEHVADLSFSPTAFCAVRAWNSRHGRQPESNKTPMTFDNQSDEPAGHLGGDERIGKVSNAPESPSSDSPLTSLFAGGNRAMLHPLSRRATPNQAPVPTRRASRLMHLGRLAGGIAGGMVAEGARRLANGTLPSAGELLLTPGNAARMAERLSTLRGAAMKVGQLLSMEAGEFLPAEFTALLARLREDAHAMPLSQVATVLDRAWGADWHSGFSHFKIQPLAAASIGQVHEAITSDGRHLAVKIQYPGVRGSIESDVDNVASLLTMFRLLPSTVDIAPLLEEAKQQLYREADYEQERQHIDNYAQRLGDDPAFTVPRAVPELTTPQVLAMSFVAGEPIERLSQERGRLRNRVAASLLELALREFFDWGLVQTDPNFANYRFDRDSGRIGLLDFGATRTYDADRIVVLRQLLAAAMSGDRSAVEKAAAAAGYLTLSDPPSYRAAVTTLIIDAGEPARRAGQFDFAGSELARRMSEKVLQMHVEQQHWRVPPPDVLFLHRKLGGLYSLCARLRARVDVRSLMTAYI